MQNRQNLPDRARLDEEELLRRRFPRAGYWLGALDEHPVLHAHAQPRPERPLRGLPAHAPLHHVYHPPPPPPPPPPQYHHPPVAPADYYPPFPLYPGDHAAHACAPPPPGNQLQAQARAVQQAPYGARGPQAPAAPFVGAPSQIKVSIPRNTGVAGAVVSRVTIKLPFDISFADFFDRVCAQMDLHPGNTHIGYKYHNDRARDAPHQLSTEEELREAFDVGAGLMQRARSRVVVMEIHNLNPAIAASRKRRAAQDRVDGDPNEPSTTLTFVKELRMLKEHLICAAHPGRFCYVSPINGEHIHLDTFKLTLWAKKIFMNEATIQHPPDTLGFDHVVKKPRRAKSPSNPAAPAIHLHIPGLLPLGDAQGQRRANVQVPVSASRSTLPPVASPSPPPAASPTPPPVASTSTAADVIDLTESSDSDVMPEYMSVGELLVRLDEDRPELGVLRFLPVLHQCGFRYVDSIRDHDIDRIMECCDMAFDVAIAIVLAAREATWEATRHAYGKTPPRTMKVESPSPSALPSTLPPSVAPSPPSSPSPSPSTTSSEDPWGSD